MEEKEQLENQIPTESATESKFKKAYDSLVGNVDDSEEITPATIDEEEKSRNENGITRSKQEIIQPSNVSLDLKDEEIVDIEELEEGEEKVPFVPLVIQKDPEDAIVQEDILPSPSEALMEESPRPIDLIAPETLSPASPLIEEKPLEVAPEPLLEVTQSIPIQIENSQEINSTEPQVALEEPQEELKKEEPKNEEMDIVEKESPQEKNESQELSTQELSTQEREQLPKEDKETSSNRLQRAELEFQRLLQNFQNDAERLAFIEFVDVTLQDYGLSLLPSKPKRNVQPKKTKGKRNARYTIAGMDKEALLKSPDSILTYIYLKDVINLSSFNLLTPEEKDSLMPHLPPIDKTDPKAIESMFCSDSFASHLPAFQNLLAAGEFEQNDHRKYIKGKKQRAADPWKERYYESYWGELKKKRNSPRAPKLPVVSFTEEARKNRLQSKRERTESIPEEKGEEKKPLKRQRQETSTEKVAKDEREANESVKSHSNPKLKVSQQSSFRDAAYTILQRAGKALTASEIAEVGLREGLIQTTGKTPQNSLASIIYCEMKKDPSCPFTKAGPMTFGLKEFNSGKSKESITKRRQRK